MLYFPILQKEGVSSSKLRTQKVCPEDRVTYFLFKSELIISQLIVLSSRDYGKTTQPQYYHGVQKYCVILIVGLHVNIGQIGYSK